MKKKLCILTSACCLLAAAAQQFTPQTNTVVTVPALTWRSTGAQLILRQLLSLTNASGSPIIPPGLFTNRSSTLFIRVETGTNGLQSIRARIQ
jgi:hypothetical protein